MNYQSVIAKAIKEKTDLEEDIILNSIEVPPKQEMGDYAFPCFPLARSMKKAPAQISQQLAQEMKDLEGFAEVKSIGPYLNFFVDRANYVASQLEKILQEGERYGTHPALADKQILIEYSSPNVCKKFHIGHIFTTILGGSLQKIYKQLGYKTFSINHLGDYGTQFGKQIVAFQKWADPKAFEKNPIDELLRIYIKLHQEAEKDPTLDDQSREAFAKLEQGDPEHVRLWKMFREKSINEYKKTYKRLNIDFDSWDGESFFSDKMQDVIEELERKKVLKLDKGAKIVDLEEYGMPPCIVVKSDGSSIYATRDLAAAKYRHDNYKFEKCLYVVANDQSLHFKQLFKVLELAGHTWHSKMVHVPFGIVNVEGLKMSTRKGNMLLLEDVFDTAVQKAKDIIEHKNPSLADKDKVAEQVGVGAVVYEFLKNGRIKNHTFSWDEALNFEGETGPYVQYTRARACSVLRKAGDIDFSEYNPAAITGEEEFTLLKSLVGITKAMGLAADKNDPYILTRQVTEIARCFNRFYNTKKILKDATKEEMKARLALTQASVQILSLGLQLLGIGTPDEM